MTRVLLIAAVVAAATVAWVPPHAVAVSAPACPTHAPRMSTFDSDVFTYLVKPGATSMRLCRYYGPSSADAKGLRQQRLIRDNTKITQLTNAFNKLNEPTDNHCPRNNGARMLVLFRYPSVRAQAVIVQLSGCRLVTGRIPESPVVRQTTPHLQHRLRQLVSGAG